MHRPRATLATAAVLTALPVLTVLTVLTALTALVAALAVPAPGSAATVGYPMDQVDAVRPGALSVSGAATGTWAVGDLVVEVTPAAGLVVRDDQRVVWAAPPGAAFVTAGRGSVAWTEHQGYFWPAVTYTDRLDTQSIDVVTGLVGGGEPELRLSGTLSSSTDGAAPPAAYALDVRPRATGGVDLTVRTGAAIGSTSAPVTSVGLVSGRSTGAGVHGFGEQFAGFDLDGRLLPIVDREQGVGRGEQPITALADATADGAGGTDQMTYAAWASFVDDDLRGVRLDPDRAGSHAFAVADLRDPGRVGLESWRPSLAAQAVAAATPTGLVAAQQAGEHRPALARWATDGAIVGLQGGTAAVRRKLGALERAGARISGVWIQDWTGQRVTSFGSRLWWTWQLDRRRYPHWRRLVADLARRGIRTTTYMNPFLVDPSTKTDRGGHFRDLYADARRHRYLVEDSSGRPYALDQGGFDAYLVDLSDARARRWYAGVVARYVLADGVRGFMADFGEGLPMDAVVHGGPAPVLHDRWPDLWARTVQRGCRLAGVRGCVTWFRSGSLGQARHAPLFWNGDQLVTASRQDGLASALLGALSAGVSGWPLVHSDVGGYTSVDARIKDYVRSPELLERWAEYQAFGVVMRTHEGNRPEQNTQVYDTPSTARAFARMTRLFAALAPYRRTVVAQARRTGVPAVRPVWLEYPGTAAADRDDEFLLGAHLLVAPVFAEGASTVTATLPPGRWVDLRDGRRYDGGGEVVVDAPLGHPAAFARAGDPWLARLRDAVRTVGS